MTPNPAFPLIEGEGDLQATGCKVNQVFKRIGAGDQPAPKLIAAKTLNAAFYPFGEGTG